MTTGVEVLALSEGATSNKVLGRVATQRALRHGLAASKVDHEVVDLGGPLSVGEKIWVRPVAGLGRLDLDLQPSRWHHVVSRRARRAFLERARPRALVTDGHTISLELMAVTTDLPLVVMADATIRQWAHLAVWRRVRPWTDATLRWSLAAERRVFEGALTLAYTEWAADGVRREVPRADVVVHSPGVDIELFAPASHRKDGPTRLLFVGGRFAEKGGHDLLAATRSRRPHDLELDVVTGDAVPAEPGVRVHRLAAGDPALVQLYQQADVLVLPSYAEGTPFVVLEAFACGIPVIGSTVGAMPTQIGERGVTVKPGDVDRLRRAIDELTADPARLDELGRRARAHAEAEHDDRLQAERMLDHLGVRA